MADKVQCPHCKNEFELVEEERQPYEASVLGSGGNMPIGYGCHQDILFVIAPEREQSQVLGPDGKPSVDMKEVEIPMQRYVNIDRLPQEMKEAIRAEIKKKKEAEDAEGSKDSAAQ